MSKKAWIIFAAVCVVLLGGLVYLSSKNRVDIGNVDINKIQTAQEASGNIGDHVFGKSDSKVTLIEYGDFQCPGCGSAHPNLKQVTEKYEDQIAFVFRNFPLTSIHPNAKAAAATAEAAGIQGKYWEMHNKLYENQSSWETLSTDERTNFFADYAKELGLNVEKFRTDLISVNVNKKISYDLEVGKKAKVTGTPAIFLNGETIDQDTWNDPAKLDKAIVDAMKANGISLPATEAN